MERFLRVVEPRGDVVGVAIVLHGGYVRAARRAGPLTLAALRMYPFGVGLARRGIATAFVRYGAAGWNDGARVPDGREAVVEATRRWPDVPVALLGHSMGARIALRVADAPGVVGVVALAPWVPPGEPVEQLAGRAVAIVQGDRDRTTRPEESLRYAAEATPCAGRVTRTVVPGGEHKLLVHAGTWQRLARAALLDLLATSRTPR